MREALAQAEEAGQAGEIPIGAVVMADVPHIVYALSDAVVHSKKTLEANPYVWRHIKSYFGGVLADESAQIIGKYRPRDLKYIQTGSNY